MTLELIFTEHRNDAHHLGASNGASQQTLIFDGKLSLVAALDFSHLGDEMRKDDSVGGKVARVKLKLVENVVSTGKSGGWRDRPTTPWRRCFGARFVLQSSLCQDLDDG